MLHNMTRRGGYYIIFNLVVDLTHCIQVNCTILGPNLSDRFFPSFQTGFDANKRPWILDVTELTLTLMLKV